MSMQLMLYKTESPNNKINKDLRPVSQARIDLKDRPKDFNNLDAEETALLAAFLTSVADQLAIIAIKKAT